MTTVSRKYKAKQKLARKRLSKKKCGGSNAPPPMDLSDQEISSTIAKMNEEIYDVTNVFLKAIFDYAYTQAFSRINSYMKKDYPLNNETNSCYKINMEPTLLEELEHGIPYHTQHTPTQQDEILKKYLKCEIPVIYIRHYNESKHQLNDHYKEIMKKYREFIDYLRIKGRNEYSELFPTGKENLEIDDIIDINEFSKEFVDIIYDNIYIAIANELTK
jgi:hypothetical protein